MDTFYAICGPPEVTGESSRAGCCVNAIFSRLKAADEAIFIQDVVTLRNYLVNVWVGSFTSFSNLCNPWTTVGPLEPHFGVSEQHIQHLPLPSLQSSLYFDFKQLQHPLQFGRLTHKRVHFLLFWGRDFSLMTKLISKSVRYSIWKRDSSASFFCATSDISAPRSRKWGSSGHTVVYDGWFRFSKNRILKLATHHFKLAQP